MQVNRLPKSKSGGAGDQECAVAAAAGSPRKQVAIVPPEPRWIADNEECCGGGGEGTERPQRHLKMNKGQGGEGGEERV